VIQAYSAFRPKADSESQQEYEERIRSDEIWVMIANAGRLKKRREEAARQATLLEQQPQPTPNHWYE
jgi:hypothetical protein